MNENTSDLLVERASYSPELAAGLGRLLIYLSDDVDGLPVEQKLRSITQSPTTEQIIACLEGRVVGAATLTQLGGLMPINKAWLEDFVVDPAVRGKGVADAIADEWEIWCQEKGISTLMFTSAWSRQPAHKFYLRRGARILNDQHDVTAFFNYPIPQVKVTNLEG